MKPVVTPNATAKLSNIPNSFVRLPIMPYATPVKTICKGDEYRYEEPNPMVNAIIIMITARNVAPIKLFITGNVLILMFNYEYWGFGTYNAAVNMALEEAMLLRAKKKAAIRFYDFARDSVVLGYAQSTDALKKRDADVVRRVTGGSHVQTGKNILAYSIAVPRDGSFRGYEDMRAYYAEKIRAAVENMGIDDVTADNHASSINIGDKVVAGHAMFWGVESALIHGLILIEPYQMEKLAARIALGKRKIGTKTYSEYDALKNAPTVAGETDAAKNAPQRNNAVKNIMAERILAELAGGKHANEPINEKTVAKAMPLLAKRYGNDAWTEERSPSFTSEDVEEIPGEELNGGLKKKLGYCMYLQVNDRNFRRMASND